MLNVEVVERVYHTATLSDEEERKVLDYIKNNPDEFEFMSDESKIIEAVFKLYFKGEIDIYEDTIESDCETEGIGWSEFEERTAEEILEG